MVDKFTDFEKHTSNILKLLDQKSRTTVAELNDTFEDLKKQLERRYDKKVDVKHLPIDEKSLTEQTTSAPQTKPEEKKPDTKPEEGKP
jgi:hypothetical protein